MGVVDVKFEFLVLAEFWIGRVGVGAVLMELLDPRLGVFGGDLGEITVRGEHSDRFDGVDNFAPF